jgi:uncharacterized protein YerC
MSKPKIEKDITIPLEILAKLLTPSEIRMLKNRWQIINLIDQGLSVRVIAQQVKVGTDTVVRVTRMAERKNLKKTINLIKEKEDIDKSSTSWIFGKSDD